MKPAALLLLLAVSLSAAPRAYLIRFGVDARPDVDWSGSIPSSGVQLSGWQFGTADSLSGSSWKCKTVTETYWDTPYEAVMQPTSNRDKLTAKGIRVETSTPGDIPVSTAQGKFNIPANLAIGDAPLLVLDNRASIQAVAPSTFVTRDNDVEDYPSLMEARDGTLWLAYQSFAGGADRIKVQRLQGVTWSQPETISEAPGDFFRTAIAQDRNGRIWVVWSAQTDGNFDLYARSTDGRSWSRTERLTTAVNADIFHTMLAGTDGNLYLAWQSARNGNFDIYLKVFDGKAWSPDIQVSSDPASDWQPALAAPPNGGVTILWDTYSAGNYDVVSRTFRNGKLDAVVPIAASAAFEARPSARYDARGRLWIAWDEGDSNWGKDYGYAIGESGRGILTKRQARVAVLEAGQLRQLPQPLAAAVPEDLRQVFHQPDLVLDGAANPWVFYRVRVNTPQGGGKEAFRAMWRIYASMWRNGRWSDAMEFDGYGRVDMAGAAIPRSDGSIAVVWASDGRVWPYGHPAEQDLHFASLPKRNAGPLPGLVPYQPPADVAASHPTERADVARIRAYRTQINGKTLRIVRGDLHRHTDLSWDGNRDGSLDDAYRYSIDAAAFDYVGICDHQAGMSIPYNWWRLQKAVDMYTIRDRFTPVYSYERSLPWPNGHRNVFFSQRGIPVLDISTDEERGREGAGKLYAYLKQFTGITSAHTTASGMGTDFRDSDADVEPIVEIYQGYRSSSENQDGPRSATRKENARFAKGLVASAWERGIKLGVQASSDHVSTHISYAAFWVEKLDRDEILAAMRARHSYAATDNIIFDVRMGDRFMGDIFTASTVPLLSARIAGTANLRRVEVVRNNRVVYTEPGSSSQVRFTFQDRDPLAGESWYYVRVEQENGQVAWSSPIWLKRD